MKILPVFFFMVEVEAVGSFVMSVYFYRRYISEISFLIYRYENLRY
jgi:hypothetical protein